jgi:hypothetical protein
MSRNPSRLFPCAPRYSSALVASERHPTVRWECALMMRLYAVSHQLHTEQVGTLVLLPVGAIYHGTQRNTIELSSVQKLTASIALYRGDVNMVCLRYAETQSKNHPIHGTRQRGDCCYQSILWADFRQRGHSFCLEQGVQRDTAVHPTQAPNKERRFIPRLKDAGFPARFPVTWGTPQEGTAR